MDARATYNDGRSKHEAAWSQLDRRSRLLGLLRLVVALLFFGTVGGIAWARFGTLGSVALVVLILLFLALVRVHARVEKSQDRAAAARRFHERGLERLDGKWMRTGASGERFRSPLHPYTDDLDVFGPASLFEHLDATTTRFGEERLASLLDGRDVGAFPADVLGRGAAVRELAPNVAFREQLYSAGALAGDAKLDPTALIAWAEATPLPAPHPARNLATTALALATLAALGLHYVAGVPLAVGIALIAVELLVSALWRDGKARLRNLSASAATLERYMELLHAVEQTPFQAELLVQQKGRLSRTGRTATDEIRALARIVSFVDARQNDLFRLFIGPVLLWDEHCAIALDSWRRRVGPEIRQWFDVIGELEAAASLAGFAFERPAHAWPTFEREPCLRAEDLGHPLLSDEVRVGNDVALGVTSPVLVITGSNMSGKSTLLRAIGVNVVLAFAGAPVAAKSFAVGRYRVATSMRIRDSLEQNVSHFYAELRRLKLVLDMSESKGEGALLFLLDEILHGTNSRERVLGARSVVKRLVASGAQGGVSTHDVGIADLERELGGRVRNVHFQEHIEADRMSFDYRLRPGVVQTSNALRLMQQVGIDVTDVLPELTNC